MVLELQKYIINFKGLKVKYAHTRTQKGRQKKADKKASHFESLSCNLNLEKK